MPRVILVADRSDRTPPLLEALAKEPAFVVAGAAVDAVGARKLLNEADYELVFLLLTASDADLFGRMRAVRRGARIVFVTAPSDLAMKTLQQVGADYLVEPVSAAQLTRLLTAVREKRNAPALVAVKDGIVTRLLRTDEIRAIVANQNYTEVIQSGSGVN